MSSGFLSPNFKPSISNYTDTVLSSTKSLFITAFANSLGATIQVNNNLVFSGQPSANIALNPGFNKITIFVLAQDGITTKNYLISVFVPPAPIINYPTSLVFKSGLSIKPVVPNVSNIGPLGYPTPNQKLNLFPILKVNQGGINHIQTDGEGNVYFIDFNTIKKFDGKNLFTIDSIWNPSGNIVDFKVNTNGDVFFTIDDDPDAIKNYLHAIYWTPKGTTITHGAIASIYLLVSPSIKIHSFAYDESSQSLYVLEYGLMNNTAYALVRTKGGTDTNNLNITYLPNQPPINPIPVNGYRFEYNSDIFSDLSGNVYIEKTNKQMVGNIYHQTISYLKIQPNNFNNPSLFSGVHDNNSEIFAIDPTGNVFQGLYQDHYKMYPNGSSWANSPIVISGFSEDSHAVDNAGVIYSQSFNFSDPTNLLFPNYLVKTIPTGGYFIDKPLPRGLSLDPHTGIISGTPIGPNPAKNYTVTAYNALGSTNFTFNLMVNE